MKPTSDQKKHESSAKPKSGKADERGNQPAAEAKARGQGENPAANSANPKERSPRQENL